MLLPTEVGHAAAHVRGTGRQCLSASQQLNPQEEDRALRVRNGLTVDWVLGMNDQRVGLEQL